jgi:predicted nucleotidyltransferase
MRMNQKERQVVDAIVARLKHDYHAEQVYLYGSAVRGQLEPDSDIDLLAVLPEANWEIKKKICDLCFENELSLGRIISVVCIASQDFYSSARQCSPFLLNVRKEGVAQ